MAKHKTHITDIVQKTGLSITTVSRVLSGKVHNFITIISDSDENTDIEKRELHELMSRNIEGLIIVPCGNNGEDIKKLYNDGLPIVCVDRYFDGLDIPYVSTDNYDGAYVATSHLINQGHSVISKIAIKFLFSQINGNRENIGPGQVLLKPKLILRDSVRRVERIV